MQINGVANMVGGIVHLALAPSTTLPSGPSAKSTGTQCIDSTWGTLNKSIPKTLANKRDHAENTLIETYAYSWLYRVNRGNQNGFEALGRRM